jgi:hypothetical protein
MRGALVASLAIALCGCTDQSMTKQPHYGPNGPAPVFANGSAAQTPPAAVLHRPRILCPPDLPLDAEGASIAPDVARLMLNTPLYRV